MHALSQLRNIDGLGDTRIEAGRQDAVAIQEHGFGGHGDHGQV
jgi:hypothetical protein